MKKVTYNKNNETKEAYKLEEGDEFTPIYEKAVEYGGKPFKNYGIQANHKELGEIFVILTETQKNQLGLKGNVKDQLIKTEGYDSQYGRQVGIVK